MPSPQRGCPQLREPPSPQPARATRGAVSSPHERRRSLLGLCYPVRRLREKSFSLRLFFTFFFFFATRGWQDTKGRRLRSGEPSSRTSRARGSRAASPWLPTREWAAAFVSRHGLGEKRRGISEPEGGNTRPGVRK